MRRVYTVAVVTVLVTLLGGVILAFISRERGSESGADPGAKRYEDVAVRRSLSGRSLPSPLKVHRRGFASEQCRSAFHRIVASRPSRGGLKEPRSNFALTV